MANELFAGLGVLAAAGIAWLVISSNGDRNKAERKFNNAADDVKHNAKQAGRDARGAWEDTKDRARDATR
ncbi:hypothetical protein KFL_003260030 [Klebsormidium nitens]|uniref:YtxH domain-containing protein n=1 Tax=Klebsormidium nitens TaxID=105231 RepID=A0A1Y1I7U5_KLENI|nr:hypothetical protein KFL_003260030 [Klebsormidium nitens]|eukprot:GAQ87020.1 hypothetical protein KFL_003260030 [Klebsormidium nitens]